MPAMSAFRRLLPRRIARDQYSFELLRSSSAQDVIPSSPHAELPRYYSNYDHVLLQTPPTCSTSKKAVSIRRKEDDHVALTVWWPRKPRNTSGLSTYQKNILSTSSGIVALQRSSNALVHAGIPSPYIRLLDECFSNTSTTIQLFDRKLKISIGKGVRQGDTISPKLFTAALQDAMKDLNWDDKGYLVDGKRISNFRFADDIVLISTSTAEVEEMLNELNVAGMKIGLDMNMSKTQFMVNQWCDTGLVRLNGVALQQVNSYFYLGRELNIDNDLAPEIARRRRAAWADFSSIREVTDQVKDPGLMASILNASVLPAMCYATETWPDNKTINRQSNANHASCTGEMSPEHKPSSAMARRPTKLGAKGEVAISRPVAVHEEVQISLGRTPASTKGR
ncbi:unnamed protein product [Heligmosomoides polygyrus]|uniref:Reverse transcriptase domain-containing protein n=1 Tax=Heligmosomoides polygyrus TaxID=6339 RepID=A0A183G5D3_HELPZ|nr:unnamed protein product [Heligmosomoides polygyrus]